MLNRANERKKTKRLRDKKKTEQVIDLLEKEKKRLLIKERNLRTAIKDTEHKSKKQELLEKVWTSYIWITDYLKRTTK